MRDSKTTEYKKTIAITKEQYRFIEETRGKKSKAGRLKEIIWIYQDLSKKQELQNEEI